MIPGDSVDDQRARSTMPSSNERLPQRKVAAIPASRLFANAVKDARRSTRSGSERLDPGSHESEKVKSSKRRHSPGADYTHSSGRYGHKTRRVESESAPEKSRSHSADVPQYMDTDIMPIDRPSHDQSLGAPPSRERSRYVNERIPTEPSGSLQQPRSILNRLGRKGGVTTAYINPAFYENAEPVSNNAVVPSAVLPNIGSASKQIRCRDWPNCERGPSCQYHHPTEICPLFPNCPNSPRSCLNIHPAGGSYLRDNSNSFGREDDGLVTRGRSGGYSHNTGSFKRRESLATDAITVAPEDLNTDQPNMGKEVKLTVQTGANQAAGGGTTDIKAQWSCAKASFSAAGDAPALITTVSDTTSAAATSNSSAMTNLASSVQSASSQASIAVLCKFGENCANTNCAYAHASPAAFGTGVVPPTVYEAACKYGSTCANPKCFYSHPSPALIAYGQPCRYYPSCVNPACPYLHIDHSKEPSRLPVPCRHGAQCTRADCRYIHPWDTHSNSKVPCKFDVLCRRLDCKFFHPKGKSKSTFASADGEESIVIQEDLDDIHENVDEIEKLFEKEPDTRQEHSIDVGTNSKAETEVDSTKSQVFNELFADDDLDKYLEESDENVLAAREDFMKELVIDI